MTEAPDAGKGALTPRATDFPRWYQEVVALAELAAPGVFREERWTRLQRPVSAHLRAQLGPDGSYPVWFFELPDDTVWGATARVLVELLRRVLQV